MHRPWKAARFATFIVFSLGAGADAGSIRKGHPAALSEAAALKIYEHEVVLRDRDPEKFDQIHKLGGRLLASEAVYEQLLHEWKAHPVKFENAHECVWRVLEGDMYYHELHPFQPPVLPGGDPPITPVDVFTPPGGGPTPPNDPPPGGGVHSASVPEPSAFVLLASGLVLVSLAEARRRFKSVRPVSSDSESLD
jgi:hypothetical protein